MASKNETEVKTEKEVKTVKRGWMYLAMGLALVLIVAGSMVAGAFLWDGYRNGQDRKTSDAVQSAVKAAAPAPAVASKN